MYNKDSTEGEGAPSQGLEGGLQTEGLHQRRAVFPSQPGPSTATSPTSPPEPEPSPRLSITVAPFTGGPFEVRVGRADTIEDLKKVIARRLKVAKERIYLLYRESELVEGSIGTNLLVDGSTVTLLPRAETGLISPKPEQSVMQALESLNEQQVNDFLSGAAPLNLTMRLGDHMMLIQLQLSTVNNQISARRKSTIQISSSSPPFPTPPPSAPTSPSSHAPPPAARKVRVPLLSPGGLHAPAPGPQEEAEPPAKRPKLDPKALAEASKNLTQTLKQLSSEVLTTKPEAGSQRPKKEERQRKRRATDSKGAIIESMHHHGKGVYSGTFSGTLNPALQDANGQPKRDITTIVHILNDLLCAQFKAYSSSSRPSRHRAAPCPGAHTLAPGPDPDPAARQQAERERDVVERTREKVALLRRELEARKARRVERRRAAARAASYSTAWSLSEGTLGPGLGPQGLGLGPQGLGLGPGPRDQPEGQDFLAGEPEPCSA